MDPNSVPTNSSIPLQTPAPSPSKSNNLGLVIGIIILGLILGFGGYYLGQVTTRKSAPTQIQTPPATRTVTKDPFLDNQTALVHGEIISISNSMLSLKNNRGQIKNFSITPQVIAHKIATGAIQASSSASLSPMDIGKTVDLNLELVNGQYELRSILIFPYIVPSIPSPKP